MSIATAVSSFGMILIIVGVLTAGTALYFSAKILNTNLTFTQSIFVIIISMIFTFFPYGKLLSLVAFFMLVKAISKAGLGEIFVLLVLQVVVFLRWLN